MAQCERYLCGKELRHVFLKPFDLNQMSKQLSTFDKLHQEVNAEFILEDELHVDKERVVDGV
jgi:hypothetical protein